MKIKLLKDWDFFPNIEKQTGYFTGRELLKERLFNEIIRRNSGAVLLSGSRGVGKTALVYESLRNVREEIKKRNLEKSIWKINKIIITKGSKTIDLFFLRFNIYYPKFTSDYQSKITLLPIIINASQLDLNYTLDSNNKTNVQFLRKEIIILLIRGLFSTVKKIDNKKLSYLNDIYKKALATEYRISQDIKRSTSFEYGFKGEVKVNFDGFISLAISFLISLTIFVGVYILVGTIINIPEIFKLIISSIPSLGVLILAVSISKKYVKSDTERESYIRDDNSVTNLEIMLENVLEELNKYFKPVYIIDELDYLEKTKLNEGSHISIISLIKTYKNLFNLVDAIFIFIAGQDTWNILRGGDRKDIQHTLFTSNVFLPKPEFSDIKEYIKTISPEIKKWDNKEEKLILNYLVYKSKAEYFDLKNVINNNITKYLLDDRPVLEIIPNQVNSRQSRVQEVIEILFNYQKYKEFERNEENYNLLELIYKICDMITPVDNFVIRAKDRWDLEVEDDHVYTSGQNWFKNLITVLEWLRMIEKVDIQNIEAKLNLMTQEVEEKAYEIITYRWTGLLKPIPTKLRIETEETKEFRKEFENVSNKILFSYNTLNYLGKGSQAKQKKYSPNTKITKNTLEIVSYLTGVTLNPFYDEQFTLLQNLDKDIPDYITADELVKRVIQIESLKINIHKNKVGLIGRLLFEVAKMKKYDASFYTENDNPQFLSVFPEIKGLLKNTSSEYILYSTSTDKRLLFCADLDIDTFQKLNVSNISKRNNLRIINITEVPQNKKLKKTTDKILINIPYSQIVQGLYNTKEGKKTLNKLSIFLRWTITK